MKSFSFPVRAVLYREDGSWVAHCLEFDLCGNGETPEDSLRSLSTAMVIQIEHSIKENNPANLFCPADGRFFQMFAAGKNVAFGSLEMRSVIDGFEIESVDAREYEENFDGDLMCV